MRKARFVKNVNCPMTQDMFEIILKETNKREIPFSEYIREALEFKIKIENSKDE